MDVECVKLSGGVCNNLAHVKQTKTKNNMGMSLSFSYEIATKDVFR